MSAYVAWCKNYCQNRQARVKFQGEISEYKQLQNGTPQGGILSPFLFNILMENIAELNFPQGIDIFIYADDLTVISSGMAKAERLQSALDAIVNKSNELGLKINIKKTKILPIKLQASEIPFKINNEPIDFVTTHKYLGVIIDQKLNFQGHIKYLRERANTRLSTMRFMTSLEEGAGYHVQRAFYMACTRSLIDYSSPGLANLSEKQFKSLEVVQNNATRLMLGAPMWTKTCNLNMECGLPSLQMRIHERMAHIATKTVMYRTNSHFHKQFIKYINDPNIRNTYSSHVARSLTPFEISRVLQNIIPDEEENGRHIKPPWEPSPAIFRYTALPVAKSLCTDHQLKIATIKAMQEAELNGALPIFTDGTVDPDTGLTGAAVYSSSFSASWRTTDGCSTMQTELAAMMKALEYSAHHENCNIVIHTDCKSTMQALQQPKIRQNINLIGQVHQLLELHRTQVKTVTINWIPSHICIQ